MRVPKPVAVRSNVLVMEFIGEDGVSAPSLKEQSPSNPDRGVWVVVDLFGVALSEG